MIFPFWNIRYARKRPWLRWSFFFFLCAVVAGAGIFLISWPAAAEDINGNGNGKRSEIEQEIRELEKQADELDKHVRNVQTETKSLGNAVKEVDLEVKRRELEIRRLTLAVNRAATEIKQKSDGIDTLSEKIEKTRHALAAGLLLLYTSDQENALTILLGHKNFSDFFGTLYHLEKAQSNIGDTLGEFKEDRALLEEEKVKLEEFREEQQELKALQQVERHFLGQKRKEKEELLRLTKGKEALFQKLLQSKKKDIVTLKTQLFYLEKTGITAEDAVRLADLAASRAGIRTAFLLALLEVETGKQFEDGVISVGTNVGTGNWEKDLYQCYIRLGKRQSAEAEKRAFMEIMEKLGLNPDMMPVSRKPSYGCGGAMGPAQFLPTTWLRFERRVAELTGHNPPNPWNVEDAFTAAAVFLASAGADSKTSVGEIAAAKTYLSGSPRCTKSICRYYSNRIIALAKEIDRIL